MEERASCLFVRRIADERRRASSCFSHIAYPYPPPPAPKNVTDASAEWSLRQQRERLNDLERYEAPRKTDSAQWAFDSAGALEGAKSMLASLGETNPILKGLLDTAVQEITDAGAAGRRLMQRPEYNTRMTDALITHEIMTFYGKGGIPGVSFGSCQALCEATKQDDRAEVTDQCNAYAFKRAAPFSYTDQSGWCYLLQNAGACKLEDFGVELYTRQIESERQCSASAPGFDSAPPPPLGFCVGEQSATRPSCSGFALAHNPPLAGRPIAQRFSPTHNPSTPSPIAHRAIALPNAQPERPIAQIRSAWASRRRGMMRACSPTPTPPPSPTRCPTTGTRRPAAAGCRCRAPPSRP